MRYILLASLLISLSAWAAPNACVELFSKSTAISQNNIDQRIKDLAQYFLTFASQAENPELHARQVSHFKSEMAKLSNLDTAAATKFRTEVQRLHSGDVNRRSKADEARKRAEEERKKIVEKHEDMTVREIHTIDHRSIHGKRYMTFTTDSKNIVLADDNGIRILEIATGQMRFQHDEKNLPTHEDQILVSDHSLIMAQEESLRIFDLQTKRELPILKLQSKLRNMQLSPLQNYLVVHYIDDSVDVIEMATRKVVKTYPRESAGRVVLSSNEENIINSRSFSGPSKTEIFNIKQNAVIKTLKGRTEYVQKNDLILVPNIDGAIGVQVWDVNSNAARFNWPDFSFTQQMRQAIDLNQDFIVFKVNNAQSEVKNIHNGQTVYYIEDGFDWVPSSKGNSVINAPNEKGEDLMVSRFDSQTGQNIFVKVEAKTRGGFSADYLSKDESFAILQSYAGELVILDTLSGQIIFEKKYGTHSFYNMKVSIDEKHAIFFDADQNLRVIKLGKY